MSLFRKNNNERPTLAIRNAGESAKMKVITQNKTNQWM